MFLFIVLVGCHQSSESGNQDVRQNGKLVVDDYQTIDDLYIGHISIEKDTLYLDEVEWITDENQDRIKELELSQSDMPNGYYIYIIQEQTKFHLN